MNNSLVIFLAIYGLVYIFSLPYFLEGAWEYAEPEEKQDKLFFWSLTILISFSYFFLLPVIIVESIRLACAQLWKL